MYSLVFLLLGSFAYAGGTCNVSQGFAARAVYTVQGKAIVVNPYIAVGNDSIFLAADDHAHNNIDALCGDLGAGKGVAITTVYNSSEENLAITGKNGEFLKIGQAVSSISTLTCEIPAGWGCAATALKPTSQNQGTVAGKLIIEYPGMQANTYDAHKFAFSINQNLDRVCQLYGGVNEIDMTAAVAFDHGSIILDAAGGFQKIGSTDFDIETLTCSTKPAVSEFLTSISTTSAVGRCYVNTLNCTGKFYVEEKAKCCGGDTDMSFSSGKDGSGKCERTQCGGM